MIGYRLYTLDPDSHVVKAPVIVECENDQAAVQKATQLLDGKTIEVWQLARRVAILHAK
jgi:hypothetical protein